MLLVAERIKLFSYYPAPPLSFDLVALIGFFLAVFFAGYATRIASLDTNDKVKATIDGIDADIKELTLKLPPD